MIPSGRCDAARLASAGVAAAALLVAPAALAEADQAAAEALFRAAHALLDKGDYAAGCPKFEASLALSPSASTMLNIARCHEHDGKTAAAWEDYNRAVVLNKETRGADRQKKLEAVAQKGLRELEPRLPRLRVRVSTPPPGLEVKRDDTRLPAGALGEALPIDPGPHRVEAGAPGYRSETRSVTIEEGKTVTVELTLAVEPPAGSAAPLPGAPVWAWVTGAGGVVLGGVAGFFLADDLSAIKALRANCQTNAAGTYCTPGYDYARDNTRKDRDFPLFLGLGGASLAALGVAIAGLARAPHAGATGAATAVTPWIGPGGAGAVITGGF